MTTVSTVKLSTTKTKASLEDSTQNYKVTGSTIADKVLIYPEVNVTSMDLKSGADEVHLPYNLSEYVATVKNTTLILKASDDSVVKMNIGASQTDTLLFADGFVNVKNSQGKISIGNLKLQTNKFYNLINENSVKLNASKISETLDNQTLIGFEKGIIEFPEGNKDNTVKIKVVRTGTDLSKPASVNYTINFDVEDIEASQEDILSNITGKIIFDPEVSEKYISLKLKGDNVFEDDESFNIVLSNPNNGILNPDLKKTTITISNDDEKEINEIIISNLNIAVDNTSKTEGSAFNYTLTLDKANTQPLTVNYSLSHISTDSNDFIGTTLGNVTFNAGETLQNISINTNQDSNVENDESFSLDLSKSSNLLSLNKSSVIGTILNDDQKIDKPADVISNLSVSVDNASKNEESSFNYILSLDKANTQPLTVNYSVSHISTDSNDFIGTTSGSITFNAGETSKSISINTNQDSNVENDESFSLDLSKSSSLLSLNKSSVISTIKNNDVTSKPPITEFQLDGRGDNEATIEYFDASSGAFSFIDNVTQSNFVAIYNFGPDDTLNFQGVFKALMDSNIQSDGNDVEISYNYQGTINYIKLIGVGFAVDIDSFNTNPNMGKIFFG